MSRNDPSDLALASMVHEACMYAANNVPVPPLTTAGRDDVPANTVVASGQGVACASSVLEVL